MSCSMMAPSTKKAPASQPRAFYLFTLLHFTFYVCINLTLCLFT